MCKGYWDVLQRFVCWVSFAVYRTTWLRLKQYLNLQFVRLKKDTLSAQRPQQTDLKKQSFIIFLAPSCKDKSSFYSMFGWYVITKSTIKHFPDDLEISKLSEIYHRFVVTNIPFSISFPACKSSLVICTDGKQSRRCLYSQWVLFPNRRKLHRHSTADKAHVLA